MLAFHNDQRIKDKYLKRVEEHRKADHLIQGTGWENGKGCAIGCTFEKYDHERAPIEIGMPEWLARVEDRIFECLPNDKAMLWPERLLSAIKPGVDLDQAKSPFVVFVLESVLEHFDHTKFPYVKEVVEQSIAVAKDNWRDKDAARAAADAAYAAADAAYAAADAAYAAAAAAAADAAYAAAYAAAAAADAAYAAADAADAAAARAAADAARAAAYAAARENAYIKFADKLIEIVENLQAYEATPSGEGIE